MCAHLSPAVVAQVSNLLYRSASSLQTVRLSRRFRAGCRLEALRYSRLETCATVLRECHLEYDRGRQTKSDSRQHLICDTKQGPKRVDPPEWVAHTLNQKITPSGDHQNAREHIRADVFDFAQRF